ncbi:MAG: PAS domain S-box protein [Pseudanabaenaceae cyanobacterium bins.68]|nr:PAS domain S-box protein [Pseudanabaenaceae cyanobacterium bins.68]
MKLTIQLQELLSLPEATLSPITVLIGQGVVLLDCTGQTSIPKLDQLFQHVPLHWQLSNLLNLITPINPLLLAQLTQWDRDRRNQIYQSLEPLEPNPEPCRLRAEILRDYRDYIETCLRIRYQPLTELIKQQLDHCDCWASPLLIFELGIKGIWIIDGDGKTLFCNQVFANLLAMTASEMLRSALFDFIAEPDRESVASHLEKWKAGTKDQSEITLQAGDRSTVHLLISTLPIHNKSGELIGSLGSVTDITNLKQTEIKLNKAMLYLQTAQRLSRLGIWEFDVITQKVKWSPEVFQIFARDPQLGTPTLAELQQLILVEDRNHHLECVSAAINHGQPYEIECRFYRRDRTIGYFLARGEPLRDRDHRVVQLVGTVLDLTSQKQIEAELRKTTTHLKTAQKIAKMGSWEFNPDTWELLCSEELLRILNHAPQSNSPTYQQFLEMLHPQDHPCFEELVQRVTASVAPGACECRFYRDHQSIGYLLIQAEPVFNQHNRIQLVGTILDITDRKLAEVAKQSLIQELTAFKIALERGGTVAMTDRDGKIIYVNDRMCEISGFSRAELIGSNHRLVKSGIHTPEFYEILYDTIKKGNIWQGEICNRAKNGQLYWEMATIVPLLDNYNTPEKFLVVRLDITKRRMAELALQQKTSELDRFFSLSLDLMYIGTPDGQILRLNEQWENLLGYKLAELEGKNLIDLIHPDDRARTVAATSQLMLGKALPSFSNRYICRNGSDLWLEWRAVLSDDLVFAVARDITERLKAEAENAQRAERATLIKEISLRIRKSLDLQTVFDTACQEVRQFLKADRVGIFQFEPNSGQDSGKFVAESVVAGFPSALTIRIHDHCFGEKYAPLYLKGRYAAMDDIYRLEQCHTNVLALIQVKANLVMPLICGDVLWGLLCIHQCSNPRHWQATEIDLAQQLANQLAIAIQQGVLFEQLQEELRQKIDIQQQLTTINQQLANSNHELAQTTRHKDEFLANMSHELRTPLNAILGMAEGLQEGVFGAINQEQAKALQTIERSGSHLLELINDILDLAKIESGRIQLEFAPTDLQALCSASIAFIRQQALQKQIQIESMIPDSMPQVLIDERRVRQVLINLLSNAVKFTPSGGKISLAVGDRWKIPKELNGIRYVTNYRAAGHEIQDPNQVKLNFLYITVTDTGIGLTSEAMDKLFQPFVQIDSALNRQYPGTGLGLALVRKIVEMHGGEVGLASKPGVGSCFMISLPYTIDPQTHPSQSFAQVTAPEFVTPLESFLILLAEDNEANTNTMSSYLKAKGFRIILAKDGQEAVHLAKSRQPDLILMDVQMPKMDGLEAMQLIRRDPLCCHLPIIALTALAMSGDNERCIAAGANAYLSKPVKMKQLISTIQRLLQSA